MRKIFYLLLFVTISFIANAQFSSDLVVFNPNGELFKLYLNSKLIKNSYVNKVRVNDLQSGEYKINVVFQSNKIPNLQQSIFIQENTEMACEIVRGKYGIYSFNVFEALLYFDKQSIPTMPVDTTAIIEDPRGVFCDYPMEDNTFASGLEIIKNKVSSSDKLTVAKQIATSNCLLSEQVKMILMSLTFESDKIEFAKFAYTHTFDPSNYFIVSEVFSFSSSTQELNDYINSIED